MSCQAPEKIFLQHGAAVSVSQYTPAVLFVRMLRLVKLPAHQCKSTALCQCSVVAVTCTQPTWTEASGTVSGADLVAREIDSVSLQLRNLQK